MIVYFNGNFIEKEMVRISPDDRGFLFGDGVYEVIRVYHGELFRAQDHIERLTRSISQMRIRDVDVPRIESIAQELVRQNDLQEDATVYIQVTRGAAPRRHHFPAPGTPPTVYISASPFVPPENKWETGIKVILVPDTRWARCDIKSIALVPNVMANQQAREHGADEAIFVRDGVVMEGTHSSFATIIAGQLMTHPLTNYILPSITRQVTLELCAKLNIGVKEFPIFESELKQADELMILGTTTEVMPVVQVNDWQVGNGQPGTVTRRLQQAFNNLKVKPEGH
jgi:D-alanine transaminase